MFSSKTDLWSTPQDLFEGLNNIFKFNLDVCATKDNTKCVNYFDKEVDGLSQEWYGTCWMNPPYGKEIYKWVEKAYLSTLKNDATVVCLLPARTDTRWWHTFCMKGEIQFIKGRLKFGDSKNSAPFPSVIVIFRPVGSVYGSCRMYNK